MASANQAGSMQPMSSRELEARNATIKVLIVDDDQYMRRVVRAMLSAIGVRHIHDACDGVSGLDAIREVGPDIVILDWEMPMVDGMHFVRLVRSPEAFPAPDVPIIMLTGHGDRWRVVEAARVGVNEFLLKPVSTKALRDRIVSILTQPRPMVQLNGYYGPAPRRLVVLADDPKAKAAKAKRPDNIVLLN
jgi:PleD family two-component response regulator